MAVELDAASLLWLWERVLGVTGTARDEALLESLDASTPPPQALGARNIRLLSLHAGLFGRELALVSRCPKCAAQAEFGADCEALAQHSLAPAAAQHHLETDTWAIDFRLPEAGDVAAATAAAQSGDEFVEQLLARCVLRCRANGLEVPATSLPAAVLAALSERMEALDPAASLSFVVECPACAAGWNARLEVGDAVAQKIRVAAERLLVEVDALARRYGWTEPEVLRLSALRRAAYLQLAAA